MVGVVGYSEDRIFNSSLCSVTIYKGNNLNPLEPEEPTENLLNKIAELE